MVRNAGKFGKPKRGGGKHFTNSRVLSAQDSDKAGMWDKEEGEEDSSEEDDDDDEDESSEESDGMGGTMSRSAMASASAGPSASGPRQPAGAGTSTTGEKLRPGQIDRFGNVVPDEKADSTSAEREARREAKRLAKAKASGAQGAPKKQVQIQAPAKKAAASESDEESDSDDAAPAVLPPKSVASLTKQTKQVSLEPAKKATPSSAPPPMNRKEREELAKKQAREKYLELHRAGKTDEAKADLARLAKIRKERAEAAERKAAEKASADEEKARKLAASGRK